MTMTDSERAELGARIADQRERKFGTKRAAYDAAEVNAATLDKAEAGKAVRPDLLRKIVRTLWPESDGDWSWVVGGAAQDAGYVSAPGERHDGGATLDQVMAAIREMRADIADLKRRST